jgi:hypothetical protein
MYVGRNTTFYGRATGMQLHIVILQIYVRHNTTFYGRATGMQLYTVILQMYVGHNTTFQGRATHTTQIVVCQHKISQPRTR